MNDSVSVIIPTYQHASTLKVCLDSVFAQTLQPKEIIVVDDGSTDETQVVLDSYRDRIVILKQANQGAPVARNNGFLASTGTFVIFCDADVVMEPTMLETLVDALQKNSTSSFAYSSFKWGWKLFSSFAFDESLLKRMNYIHTSALIRRDAFPMFDPTMKRFQDWDLWLTMMEQGKHGVFVDKVLFQVVQEDRPERMSNWLPSLVIKFPWRYVGWEPKLVKKYREAKEVIFKKHHLV